MFDWYEPDPPIRCPSCGAELREWQGKEGPCFLFVWRQGVASPVDQRVDDQWRLADEALRAQRLSKDVVISSYDCKRHVVDAIARVEGGTWTTTVVASAGGESLKSRR